MKHAASRGGEIGKCGGWLKGAENQTLKISNHDGTHGRHIQFTVLIRAGNQSFQNHEAGSALLSDNDSGPLPE
jgi:hypothetical protein